MDPTPEQIRLAGDRIGRVLSPTPIIRSNALSRIIGAEVFLKLENLQETGSFKVRGAYNRLVQLGDEERKRGVIAASAGNHAQGVAWASAILGIKATIVMPEQVSIKKLLAVQEYGTSIILSGSLYDDAYTYAVNRAQEDGASLIPAFDDPSVIAGQGTIGMEVMDALTDDSAVLVPVGGGGLISGIAIWLKAQKPKVRIIGVEADACPSAIASLQENRPVKVDAAPTLADGIAVKRPGEITFHHMKVHIGFAAEF